MKGSRGSLLSWAKYQAKRSLGLMTLDTEAFNFGVRAFKLGALRTDNPYPPYSNRYWSWEKGRISHIEEELRIW